jgi:hypothetical protein
MWLVYLTGSRNKMKDGSSNIQHMSDSKTLLIDLSSESETLTENGNSWVSIKIVSFEVFTVVKLWTVDL